MSVTTSVGTTTWRDRPAGPSWSGWRIAARYCWVHILPVRPGFTSSPMVRPGSWIRRDLLKTARKSLHRRERLDRTWFATREQRRSEEHTSELQSLMRISYAVLCLKKKQKPTKPNKVS